MKTIFLSGSRTISRLNDDIRARIQNIIRNGFQIIVGDANGADKAMQKYLHGTGYRNVTVYCAGNNCRNNIGEWNIRKINVDPKLKGREFYTAKDKKMAASADYGLVLWDGKSAGSINNILELLKHQKFAVVYFSPEKKIYTLKSFNDADNLVKKCGDAIRNDLKKKSHWDNVATCQSEPSQSAFAF